MRSNAHSAPEEPTSLEDSTYGVVSLSDSLYETSEDEGNTASVASTPDDVSAFSDDEDDSAHDYIDGVGGPEELHLPLVEPAAQAITPGVEESTLTETPALDQSESTRLIKMHEELASGHDGIDAWGVAKEITQAQIADLGYLKSYGRAHLRLTVRAVLSERYLPVDGSFKVLYVGSVEEWYKKDIEWRLHTVLNASLGPSRSIMVRGQMEPYGPIFASNRCKNIKLHEDAGGKSGVVVTLDDGTDLTLDSQPSHPNLASSRLPDLVIFWYPQPNLPAPEVENFLATSLAFERYQVPCLHVAEDRRLHLHSGDFAGDRNLRLCVEGRDDDRTDYEHLETIPVDIYNLLNLDPSQLNRHLAALRPYTNSAGLPKLTGTPKRWNLGELIFSFMKRFKVLASPLESAPLKVVLAFVALSGMVILCLLGTPYISFNYNMTKAETEPSISNIGIPSLGLTSKTSASTVASFTSSILAEETTRGLTVVPPAQEASQRRQEQKKKEERKAGGFQIQSTGEHQFVLNPSTDFISRQCKPQLQIQVSRDAQGIPIRFVRTAQGAYIVDLEQEYYTGSFNVSIATLTKPLMQQSFEVTLGHNKSAIDQFFGNMKRGLATLKQELPQLSFPLPKRVQSEFARIEYGIFDWKNSVLDSGCEAKNRLKAAQQEAKRQLKVGKMLLSAGSGEAWTVLRKATAPARTSSTALRARNNAFRIRCGFEKAVGLSSERQGKRKSRSCEKVGW